MKDAITTLQYFKRPMPRIEPGNASAPTEPVTALHLRNSDRSPKRETIRTRGDDVKQGRAPSAGHPLNQVNDSGHGDRDER